MTEEFGAVIPLFSTPIFLPKETFEVSESLLQFIQSIELNNTDNLRRRQSLDSYILDREELSELKQFLEKQLNVYVQDILQFKDNEFYITQSWISVLLPGEDHHPHWHQNSLVSGVFYVCGDENPIVLRTIHGDPPFGRSWSFKPSEYNLWNSGTWSCENKKNTVILFPSIAEHYVGEHSGIGPRMSIAFNSFVQGPVGDVNTKTELVFNDIKAIFR